MGSTIQEIVFSAYNQFDGRKVYVWNHGGNGSEGGDLLRGEDIPINSVILQYRLKFPINLFNTFLRDLSGVSLPIGESHESAEADHWVAS